MILAPMSGVTNRTMRALYKPFGFGLTVTEFVSSNALEYGSRRTMEMIDQHGLEKAGLDAALGRRSADDGARRQGRARVRRRHRRHQLRLPRAESHEDQRRLGLPARRRSLRGDHARRRRRGRLPGHDEDAAWAGARTHSSTSTSRSARKRAGVQAVTLHARTAKQFYRGEADWEHIARLKRAVDIPVIGNGDLDDPHVALRRMRESGVDASCSAARRSEIRGSSRRFAI